jgi:hypothetical protein
MSMAASTVLQALLNPLHGDVGELAALMLPRLSPVLLGVNTGPGKRSAAELATMRATAMELVKEGYR